MKGIIYIATVVFALSARAQIPFTIARSSSNMVITWHTQVFSAWLEISGSMKHWNGISLQTDACASEKTWVIPTDGSGLPDIAKGITPGSVCTNNCGTNAPFASRTRFFRLRPLDNGLAPTPPRPDAFRSGSTIELITQGSIHCNASPITNRLWLRDGVQIGASTGGLFTDTAPLPGFHLYQVQQATSNGLSWASEYQGVSF